MGWVLNSGVMAKMATFKLARKDIPTRKVPVIVTKAPTISGPVNPPISDTQKNMPTADPMYSGLTSGLSINISIRRGIKEEPAMPNNINAASRRAPDVVPTISRVTAASRAKKAKKRLLKCGGTRRGITRTAGMLAMRGVEAAKPATAGERPLISKILGSQLVKPCMVANDKSPIARRTWIFRTLISLPKTLLTPALSVATVALTSLARNHHNSATAKVSRP